MMQSERNKPEKTKNGEAITLIQARITPTK